MFTILSKNLETVRQKGMKRQPEAREEQEKLAPSITNSQNIKISKFVGNIFEVNKHQEDFFIRERDHQKHHF